MVYTPLATYEDVASLPLLDAVKSIVGTEQGNLMQRASEHVEAICNRRLSPFVGLYESHRAQDMDIDEAFDGYQPLDIAGQIGALRAQSLGASGNMVRHFYLREYPPMWQDMWLQAASPAGYIQSITIKRGIAGTTTVDLTGVQYEYDTGHVRFAYGDYIPPGSIIEVVYNGGYSITPGDLKQAVLYEAAEIALLDLEDGARMGIDLTQMREKKTELLERYVRNDVE